MVNIIKMDVELLVCSNIVNQRNSSVKIGAIMGNLNTQEVIVKNNERPALNP